MNNNKSGPVEIWLRQDNMQVICSIVNEDESAYRWKIGPAGTSDRDLRRLAEAEAEADVVRRKAAERVIAARQELDEARVQARRKLTRTPVGSP